jgi:hypothetical protein
MPENELALRSCDKGRHERKLEEAYCGTQIGFEILRKYSG